jgi:Asp-tRNA(Asn)/Glu-tRNA(Gln) amidotransferase A subunit family amidase
MGNELWRHGALELAGMIARREVSSVEVVQAHLSRMDEVNPKLNAVVVASTTMRSPRPPQLTPRWPRARRSVCSTACR